MKDWWAVAARAACTARREMPQAIQDRWWGFAAP